MIIFRMIEFFLQVMMTIIIVLLLQINIEGETIEHHLLSFVYKSKTLKPVRELASSIHVVGSGIVFKKKLDQKSNQSKKQQSLASDKKEPNLISTNKTILKKILPLLKSKISILKKIIPSDSLGKALKDLEVSILKLQNLGKQEDTSLNLVEEEIKTNNEEKNQLAEKSKKTGEEIKEKVKKEIKEEIKEKVKKEIKEEIKEKVKKEIKEEIKETVKKEIKEEPREEGRSV